MSERSEDLHFCFIIQSHNPYCFDLNEILALPSGFRYRNRFDTRWIEPVLQQEEMSSFLQKRVLVVLRDIESNQLIPARWGLIVSAIPVGEIFYFEYQLGDLIRYNSMNNVRLQEIVGHTEAFSRNHHWLPGITGKPLTDPSVFRSNVGARMPVAPAEDLTAWGNAVSAIATAPVYSDVEFLKIVGLVSSKNKAATVVRESYVAKSDSVYTLQVFQHVPNPTPTSPGIPARIPPHSIELNTFPEHIIALRSKQQAVGKYDMLTFVLKTLALHPGDRTAMEIPHVPDAATSSSALTSLYIPVTFKAKSRILTIIAFAIAGASLYLMFEPHLGSLSTEVVRNLATVVFVLTVAGPSRLFASIWPTWPWGT
jgi:hypothetical protein